MHNFSQKIDSSKILEKLKARAFDYFLVTLHRAENVDLPDRLASIFAGLEKIVAKYDKPMFVSVHPRTAEKLSKFSTPVTDPRIRLLEPFGFFDFVKLEKNALAVLTDSGTVQEECAIFGVPNITLRDVTERPETLECGSNILSGADPDSIVSAAELAIAQPSNWAPPPEYKVANTSQIVSKLILGYLSIAKHG